MPTIPLRRMSKRPLVKWKQYIGEPAKPHELKKFFSNGSNLGVLCGGEFGLVVIDFDDKNGYPNFVESASGIVRSIFEKTYKVETPRGLHVYLRCNNVSTRIDTERKIDIKGESSYVVAPCSIHETGIAYKDLVTFSPENILKIPRPILDKIFPEKEKIAKVNWDAFAPESNGFLSPYADTEDIKAHVSILRYAMELTNMFPKHGGQEYWMGKCPMPSHDDKDPSFWVNVRLGICGCFGNCILNDNPTDVIGLYAYMNGLSYGEAFNILREW